MIKCIILLILLIAVPYLFGNLLRYQDSSGLLRSTIAKFLMGYFMALSLFWVLCVPFSLLKISFSTLVTVYSICLIALCSLSFFIYIKEKTWQDIILERKIQTFNRFELLYLTLFLLMLGIQLYFATFYESTIWSYDDYEYVVRSQDTIASDHMFLNDILTGKETDFSYKRILNSWQIYIAYLAKMSGYHVTTIAHTILPVILLLFAYLTYTYIAQQLFDKRTDHLIFLCILSAGNIFGLYSPYSLSFRLLATLWQGKAVLSTIVIPFLIFFLPDVYTKKISGRIMFYLILISIAACSLTMMGSGMSVIVCFAMVIILSAYNKRITGMWQCICYCIIPSIQILVYMIMR